MAEQLARLFADPLELTATTWLDVPVDQLQALDARCRVVHADLLQRTPTTLPPLVERVIIGSTGISVAYNTTATAELVQVQLHPDAPAIVDLVSSARITRSGRAIRLVHDNGSAPHQPADQSLIRLLVRSRQWWTTLRQGEITMTELANREGVTASYLHRIVRLSFLSPAVLQALLAGKQRAGVNIALLREESAIAPSWREQAKILLPG